MCIIQKTRQMSKTQKTLGHDIYEFNSMFLGLKASLGSKIDG